MPASKPIRVALIPARGGSKRIPRKNIRPFLGKPIMAYPIEAARESGLFDRIIVSTDDPEIADVARQLGAEVPFLRPAALANDHAPTRAVITHALDFVESQNQKVSEICCVYATAVFVRPDDLRQGLDTLHKSGCDFVMSVMASAHPIERAYALDAQGRLKMVEPEAALTRTQDLPTVYFDAAQFYWAYDYSYRLNVTINERKSAPLVLPRWRAQDIDDEEDWTRAELLFRALNG